MPRPKKKIDPLEPPKSRKDRVAKIIGFDVADDAPPRGSGLALEDPPPIEYSSIRVVHMIGVRLAGATGNTLTAGGGRRVVFRKEPFEHFEFMPDGHQVPLINVASATPASSSAAGRQRRTVAPPEPVDRTNKLAFLESRATKAPPRKPAAIAEAEELDEDDGDLE